MCQFWLLFNVAYLIPQRLVKMATCAALDVAVWHSVYMRELLKLEYQEDSQLGKAVCYDIV